MNKVGQLLVLLVIVALSTLRPAEASWQCYIECPGQSHVLDLAFPSCCQALEDLCGDQGNAYMSDPVYGIYCRPQL